MTSKRLYRILLPAVTFLGGVFIQLLLERWISLGIVTTLSLVLVLISLAFLFTASLHILESIESKFNLVDNNLSKKFEVVNEKLIEIFNHSGLTVDCIEDGKEEISYFRASELVSNAKSSLTIVSPWHPLRELQVDTATEGQTHYYQAIERKITEHQNSKSIFHPTFRRRVDGKKEFG